MMMAPIYLDHAATTTLRPEARNAMLEAMDAANANASGTHGAARAAKNALEEARERAAAILGARSPMEIIFTSGGTEADNLAVTGAMLASGRSHLVTSAIEHKAVTEPALALERFGCSVSIVGCDMVGRVAPDDVAAQVSSDTALVSVMSANNEVGTIQPIRAIAERVREVGPETIVHTDAVQAFVGSEVTVEGTGADLISLAAHKFGGPKGVGLLFVASGVELDPLLRGGGQEAGRRSGTSNVPGIAGMVAAMQAVSDERPRFAAVVGAERDAFETELVQLVPTSRRTVDGVPRMPHFSHIRFPGVRAESLLIRLDGASVYAAAGAACQSGAVEPSPVLTAMGMSATEASECVRFTFGWVTAPGDGVRAARAVADVIGAMG